MSKYLALLLILLAGCRSAAKDNTQETVDLFNEKDLTGWTFYSADSTARIEDVWSVDEDSGILVGKGDPWGYLRTKDTYDNYRLHVEWRWNPITKVEGNSGVFFKINGPDKQWPRCYEAQLKAGWAGDLVLFEGLPLQTAPDRVWTEKPHVRRRSETNELPAGEWNVYEITVLGDSIMVDVNGKRLNEGTGASGGPGAIGLQAEGGEIHFRNIRLTKLK